MTADERRMARQLLEDAASYAMDARKLLLRKDVDRWVVARKIRAAMQDLGRALVIVTGDEWWEGEE